MISFVLKNSVMIKNIIFKLIKPGNWSRNKKQLEWAVSELQASGTCLRSRNMRLYLWSYLYPRRIINRSRNKSKKKKVNKNRSKNKNQNKNKNSKKHNPRQNLKHNKNSQCALFNQPYSNNNFSFSNSNQKPRRQVHQ